MWRGEGGGGRREAANIELRCRDFWAEVDAAGGRVMIEEAEEVSLDNLLG